MSLRDAPSGVRDDVPPSAKLVWKILEEQGELTQQDLVDETQLPVRTVRRAVEQLEDVGAVERRFSTTDARFVVYTV